MLIWSVAIERGTGNAARSLKAGDEQGQREERRKSSLDFHKGCEAGKNGSEL
jgi:hypothetical protein